MANRPIYYEQIESVVLKYLNRGNKKATEVAEEAGISIATLYNWIKVCKNKGMDIKTNQSGCRKAPVEKMHLIKTYFSLPEEKRGEFLRKEGLYAKKIDQWVENPYLLFNGKVVSIDEHKELQRENSRLKDKIEKCQQVISEGANLLLLKKKL